MVVGAITDNLSMGTVEIDDLRRAATARRQRGQLVRRERTQLAERIGQRGERGRMVTERRQATVAVREHGPNEQPRFERAERALVARGQAARRQTRRERREGDEVGRDESLARQRSPNGDGGQRRWHHDGDRSKGIALFHRVDQVGQGSCRGRAEGRDLQPRPCLHHHADPTEGM